MKSSRSLLPLALTLLANAPLLAQTITGGTCAAADLTGAYGFTLTGRAINSAGVFNASYQANGVATFDGVGKVTIALTANTNLQQGKAATYSGTYVVPSNCLGALMLTGGAAIPFSLTDWGTGNDFNIVGSDATYVYTGTGSPQPNACVNASISGPYGYTASGFTINGTAITGTGDEAGLMQFDG